MACIMACFDDVNATSSVGDHSKCSFEMDFGAEKGLERCHYVMKLGTVSNLVHETEPTTIVCGRGWKSWIASRYLSQGLMASSEIQNPVKSMLLRTKRNLSGLRTIPEQPTRIKKSIVRHHVQPGQNHCV